MSHRNKVLHFLYSEQKEKITDKVLFEWCEHTNFTVFKKDVLKKLHGDKEIEYSNGECIILYPGIKKVENDSMI